MAKKRVAIYGGCFDPPHIGHLWIAQQLFESGRFDEVWVMPNASGLSSKKDSILSADLRLRMCQTAIWDFNPVIRVTEYAIHYNLDYTYQVVQKLYQDYPDQEHTICVGEEWDVKEFKNYDLIKDKCKFLNIRRGSNPYIPKPNYFSYPIYFGVSSTIIRSRVKQGLPITGLVTPGVESFIKEKGLYK